MDARTNIKIGLPGRLATEGTAHASCAATVAASSDADNAAPHRSVNADQGSLKFDLIDGAEIFVAEIFKKTPCVAGLKPGGRYVAKDMHEISGISLLMKTLLDNGHLRGDCMTATGRTTAENLKSVRPNAVSGGVVGGKGNFAPRGAVVKVAVMSKL